MTKTDLLSKLLTNLSLGQRPGLPTFDGSYDRSTSPSLWLFQVEEQFRLRSVDPSDWVSEISLLLSGNALHWLVAWKSQPGKSMPVSWESFRTAFLSEFQSSRFQEHLRLEMRNCRQNGRSLRVHMSTFRTFVLQVEDMSEIDKLDHLLASLDDKIRKRLRSQKPKT